jgi:hypothetical protein
MIIQQQVHGFLACPLAVGSSRIFPKIDLSHSMAEKY